MVWAFLLALMAIVYAGRQFKRRKSRRKAEAARTSLQIALVRDELRAVCERQLAIYSQLDNDNEGVAKRIQDCRAIAEALYVYAPSVFYEQPDLVLWLEDMDAFLTRLADQALPVDRAHAVRHEVEENYPNRIYQVIRDTPAQARSRS